MNKPSVPSGERHLSMRGEAKDDWRLGSRPRDGSTGGILLNGDNEDVIGPVEDSRASRA